MSLSRDHIGPDFYVLLVQLTTFTLRSVPTFVRLQMTHFRKEESSQRERRLSVTF